MRKLCAMFTIGLLAGCSAPTVKITKLAEAPAKPANCPIEMFSSESDVRRPYKVVCQIDAATEKTGWGHTGTEALDDARPAACACGADAAVIVHVGSTGAKLDSWGQGQAIIKAIKFEDMPKQ